MKYCVVSALISLHCQSHLHCSRSENFTRRPRNSSTKVVFSIELSQRAQRSCRPTSGVRQGPLTWCVDRMFKEFPHLSTATDMWMMKNKTQLVALKVADKVQRRMCIEWSVVMTSHYLLSISFPLSQPLSLSHITHVS